MSNKPIDASLLEEAHMLVTASRQAQYGHPRANFNDTADMWSVVLRTEVTAEQVALCMVLVKLARELHKPKRDNLVDAIGYLLTYDAVLDVEPDSIVANYTEPAEETPCLCANGCINCVTEV
jgi:hypothetical protein